MLSVWQRYGCFTCRLVWIQEVIVSAAVLGAGVGSAIGGWFSDKVGRKKALLVGDVLFTLGALLMAAAGSPNALIAGQIASIPPQEYTHRRHFLVHKVCRPMNLAWSRCSNGAICGTSCRLYMTCDVVYL